MTERTDPQQYLTRLLDLLIKRFSLEDLRTLCFELNKDYEIPGGEGKADKARELLLYLDRRGRIRIVSRGQAELFHGDSHQANVFQTAFNA